MSLYPINNLPYGKARYVYAAILLFANGKRYLMRAPVRLWYELYYAEEHGSVHYDSETSSSKKSNKKSSVKFQQALAILETAGYIRRFPGGIEVMENIWKIENRNQLI